ncbi:rubredoxin [Sphingobium sp. CFD-1]
MLCSFVYDEVEGCPEHGIAPGISWEDVDEDWCCPDCGAGKSEFFLKDY